MAIAQKIEKFAGLTKVAPSNIEGHETEQDQNQMKPLNFQRRRKAVATKQQLVELAAAAIENGFPIKVGEAARSPRVSTLREKRPRDFSSWSR